MHPINIIQNCTQQINRTALLLSGGGVTIAAAIAVILCCRTRNAGGNSNAVGNSSHQRVGCGPPQRPVECGELDPVTPELDSAAEVQAVSSSGNNTEAVQIDCETHDRTRLFQQLYHALNSSSENLATSEQQLRISLCLELVAAIGSSEEAIPAALSAIEEIRGVCSWAIDRGEMHHGIDSWWFTDLMVRFAEHLVGQKLGETRASDIQIAKEVYFRTWPNCFHATNRAALDSIATTGLNGHTRLESHQEVMAFNSWWQAKGGEGSSYVFNDKNVFWISQKAAPSVHEFASFAPEWLKLQTESLLSFEVLDNRQGLPGWNTDRIASADFTQLTQALEQQMRRSSTRVGQLSAQDKDHVRQYFHKHWQRYRTHLNPVIICAKWTAPLTLSGPELLQRLTGHREPSKEELWEGLRQCIQRRWSHPHVRVQHPTDIDQCSLYHVTIPRLTRISHT